MSWFPERNRSWLRRICTHVLKTGPVPQHVAIIMDGNRRFAVKNSLDKAEGHLKGFDKLSETLEWCLDLDIKEVTVYAFSIENFKRSQEEIDCLMELARQKFLRLMEEKDLIEKHGVCIRVLGNLKLLPQDVQEVIAEAVNFTQNNTRAILNVCFAYTARDDMCTAMRELATAVDNGVLKSSDISEDLLEQCLYTRRSRKVDLVIRTSGEVRLSDFLLWESAYSCLAFVKVLWPEFSVWHFYAAVLHYQHNYQAIECARQSAFTERERLQRESDYKCVMEEVEQEKSRGILDQSQTMQIRLQQYTGARQWRIHTFLSQLEASSQTYFDSLKKAKPITCAS